MLREVERPDGIRVAFEYDPFARRTVKRTLSATGTIDREVDFVWDGHNVIHELDSERGLISWQWEPESFTPIGKEHAGRRWTIASDHLGTPTEMYDEVGQLAWKMQLDVYGVPSFAAGTAEDCPWRWPGQYEDGGTGLFYNRARAFSPASGGFASQDPIGLLGSPTLYSYPPDPTRQVDPFGLVLKTVDFTGSASLYPTGNTVTIEMQGSRGRDFTEANRLAGHSSTPTGYTWHHVADYNPTTGTCTMQLVTTPAHEATYPHRGSVAQFEHAHGVKYGRAGAIAHVEGTGRLRNPRRGC